MCSTSEVRERLEGLSGDELVELVAGALGRLAAEPLEALGDEALAASVSRLQWLETMVAAQKLRRIGDVDARGAWRAEGHRSTVDLLVGRLGLTPGEARAQADTATALARLPRTAARLRAGELGLGQAHVAARALEQLPAESHGQLDELVAEQGGRLDRRRLRDAVDEWAHTLAPERLAERERRAWERRRLRVAVDGADGGVVVDGRLDRLGGAKLIAALQALSRPDGEADERSFPQRQADALAALASRALDAGDLPDVAGQRPHVLLLVTPDALHGTPGAPPALLDGVGPVSAAGARQLCCDAEVTRVGLDPGGAVLDVGRARREPSARQRAAVIARDRSCVGCGALALRCELHHIRWWSRGGRTDLENLCLLCWGCHAKAHRHGWEVRRGADEHFTLDPPAHGAVRHTG
jgi:hypothetical protein